MRKYLCWLLGHSYICLFRYHWGTEVGRRMKVRVRDGYVNTAVSKD